MLRGRVLRGLGVGRTFVSKHVYYVILTEILGEEPYPGTLNVEVELPVDEIERRCAPQFMKSVIFDGSVFGGFRYWLGRISGGAGCAASALILRPDLSRHPRKVLEVVSSKYLRGHLGLSDGDYVSLELRCS
mgnify:CR=1 FL=1